MQHADPHPAPAPMHPAGVRVLVLGWCTWLLGAWLIAIAGDSLVRSARWMVFAAIIGLLLGWPAARLSMDEPSLAQRRGTPGPTLGTFADWLALNLVFQAVIWPLMLHATWADAQVGLPPSHAGWTPAQVGWVVAAVAAWSALGGVFIAWGRRGTGLVRTIAMLACAAVLLAEPVVLGLIAAGPRASQLAATDGMTMRLSPIQTLWQLTGTGAIFELDPAIPPIILTVAAAAALGWLVLAAWAGLAALHARRQAHA